METVEQLAAAVAEMVAHLYLHIGTELAKAASGEEAGERLLDKLFELVADADDIANRTSDETVRQVLSNGRTFEDDLKLKP
ncbi:MAG: hypothetical protein JWL61_5441 [Gemmatimonadetes bacterium]|nr:hypothetical protein [Gemmatimonadota bacterium]